MPRKTFTAGEVLAAADVNSFLMDQTVMTFAGTAARGSAIGTATEGMVTYLADSDSFEFWNGSAFTSLSSGGAATNAIINGGMDIWQRGTAFTITSLMYTADRFYVFNNGNGSITASRQTFTPGTAPVAGYEGSFFFRNTVASTGTTTVLNFGQRVEDVRSFAGQTATLSFWAKADASRTLTITATQSFGSGGSGDVSTSFGSASVTTSWQRFTLTAAVPSISGKTIGTGGHNLTFDWALPTAASTIDIWGVQLEAGSTASAFRRNADSLQGELATCQRYYYRPEGNIETTVSVSGASVTAPIAFPVTMRGVPSVTSNITNATYQTTPGANQWGLVQAQVSWSNKSGTATAVVVGTQTGAFLQISGATFSPQPNAIKIVPDRIIEIDAEL